MSSHKSQSTRAPRGRTRAAIAWGIVALGAVSACSDCDSAAERVEGRTPYRRCAVAEPPAATERELGALSLTISERVLTVRGAPEPLTIAAFSGPGSGPAPGAATLGKLAESGADLALLLGDIGDEASAARATLTGLAGLSIPTLVIAGGRDSYDGIGRALEAVGEPRRWLVHATTLEEIRIGEHSFIPVPGAPGGHYAIGDNACGHGLDDLKRLADRLGPVEDGRTRYLLSWHAPSGPGAFSVSRTAQGLDVGDPDLAELARRIGASGGLFAWPGVQAGRPRAERGQEIVVAGRATTGMRLVLPRIAGASIVRSDGSRLMPGYALLTLSKAGMALDRIEGTSEITKSDQ